MQKNGTVGQSGPSGVDLTNLRGIIRKLKKCGASYDFSTKWSYASDKVWGPLCPYKFEEIEKLHSMLEKANIPHSFETHRVGVGYCLCYPSDCNVILSAIEIPGSYGVEDDLIEIQGLFDKDIAYGDDVLGGQTAQQVFDMILGHYNSETVDLRDFLDEGGDLFSDAGSVIKVDILKSRKGEKLVVCCGLFLFWCWQLLSLSAMRSLKKSVSISWLLSA